MGAQVSFYVYDTASETATQIVTNSSGTYLVNLINADVYPGDPVQNAVVAGTNSYERWITMNVVSWAGSSTISNVRAYLSAGTPTTGTAFMFGSTPTYATPTNNISSVQTNSAPTTLPASANWTIQGSLTTQLTSQSSYQKTDFGVFQLQTSPSATAGSNLTVSVIYSEVS